jgi:hypothetical protein
MRAELQKRDGLRGRFSATFVRFGAKKAYKGPPIKTALFRDVRDEAGNQVTDHVWMVVGKQLEELALAEGDRIQFEARVASYVKGYRGRREDDDLPTQALDYKLSRPTHLRKLYLAGAESSTNRVESCIAALPLFESEAL